MVPAAVSRASRRGRRELRETGCRGVGLGAPAKRMAGESSRQDTDFAWQQLINWCGNGEIRFFDDELSRDSHPVKPDIRPGHPDGELFLRLVTPASGGRGVQQPASGGRGLRLSEPASGGRGVHSWQTPRPASEDQAAPRAGSFYHRRRWIGNQSNSLPNRCRKRSHNQLIRMGIQYRYPLECRFRPGFFDPSAASGQRPDFRRHILHDHAPALPEDRRRSYRPSSLPSLRPLSFSHGRRLS